jgi:hypothetical protein
VVVVEGGVVVVVEGGVVVGVVVPGAVGVEAPEPAPPPLAGPVVVVPLVVEVGDDGFSGLW